ncbi:alanyl-tRNA editing protein [Candidatus Bathyarchaeota archaeon]|nr:alanyl-tRNA editing protein [Candidatus Bathyarchaeota archaeon]
MSDEVRAHTALHVLKGAAVEVLGVKWTSGVSVNDSHGRLTLQLDRKPTEDEMRRVEDAANRVITEDVGVEEMVMGRAEAEERWGDLVYDLFPIPESVTELSICHIPGWNVNACNREHCSSTGKIGSLTISKYRYRANKGVLEISFDVG